MRISGNFMKRILSIVTLAAATMLAVPATVGHAQEDGIDKATRSSASTASTQVNAPRW
jgi:hypothetical protein